MNYLECDNKAYETVILNANITHGAHLVADV